jgi:hypothetical protein
LDVYDYDKVKNLDVILNLFDWIWLLAWSHVHFKKYSGNKLTRNRNRSRENRKGTISDAVRSDGNQSVRLCDEDGRLD